MSKRLDVSSCFKTKQNKKTNEQRDLISCEFLVWAVPFCGTQLVGLIVLRSWKLAKLFLKFVTNHAVKL